MRFQNEEAPALASGAYLARTKDGLEIPTWKRVLDISCILLALPVLLPAMLFIAVVIKIASPGPVLFLHERVGYRGRRFICFKFRTMKVNADCDIHRRHLADLMRSDAPMTKMDSKGDPRLIPFGSILRATGLDELPQVMNVFGGQMSLVGPRPCLPYEYDNYLPAQKRRFDTLPGLTGLWQVSGKNRTTFTEMISMDIRYAEIKSPWLDLKIMAKTIPALLVQVKEARERKRLERLAAGQQAIAKAPVPESLPLSANPSSTSSSSRPAHTRTADLVLQK